MSKKVLEKGRREFLKGAAVVGGAASLAVVARGGAAAVREDVKEAAPAPEASKGYHETPHIRTYYDLARE